MAGRILADAPSAVKADRARFKTLPVGVQDFFSMAVIEWGMIMAAGVVITIPALLFFVAVQRYLVAGWGTGGVKG